MKSAKMIAIGFDHFYSCSFVKLKEHLKVSGFQLLVLATASL